MNGHAFGVKGRNAGRSHNHMCFVGQAGKVPQEGGFSGTCFSCQKNGAVGAVDKMRSQL